MVSVAGSALIGQQFDDPKYFWGRLSATGPFPYNAAASSGSNLGPTNPALLDEVKARIAALKAADPTNTLPIPVDLVTSSGSGLDPEYQYCRGSIPGPTHCPDSWFECGGSDCIGKSIYPGTYIGFPRRTRVNVLELNLALDAH